MRTTKEKLNFTYGGKKSNEFEVMQVVLDNGMFEESLTATGNVQDELLRGRKTTIFSGVEKEVIQFSLTLAFKNGFDNDLIDRVISWFYDYEYYQKFQFEDSREYMYAMPDGESQIVHTGTGAGYITLQMKTNSPYLFGEIKTVEFESGVEQEINLAGLSNPNSNIDIKAIESGGFTIVLNGYTLQVNNLVAGETVTINPWEEEIESDIENVYHYDDYIGDLSKVSLVSGKNTMTVNGSVSATLSYQPYYR